MYNVPSHTRVEEKGSSRLLRSQTHSSRAKANEDDDLIPDIISSQPDSVLRSQVEEHKRGEIVRVSD